MTTKRGLITDSYKVVKKSRKGGKREKSPTPPPLPQKEADSVREEELEKLRQFDLDWRFGPCTGISRLQRWERAKLHGLNPPKEIRELLLQTHTDPEYNLRSAVPFIHLDCFGESRRVLEISAVQLVE